MVKQSFKWAWKLISWSNTSKILAGSSTLTEDEEEEWGGSQAALPEPAAPPAAGMEAAAQRQRQEVMKFSASWGRFWLGRLRLHRSPAGRIWRNEPPEAERQTGGGVCYTRSRKHSQSFCGRSSDPPRTPRTRSRGGTPGSGPPVSLRPSPAGPHSSCQSDARGSWSECSSSYRWARRRPESPQLAWWKNYFI